MNYDGYIIDLNIESYIHIHAGSGGRFIYVPSIKKYFGNAYTGSFGGSSFMVSNDSYIMSNMDKLITNGAHITIETDSDKQSYKLISDIKMPVEVVDELLYTNSEIIRLNNLQDTLFKSLEKIVKIANVVLYNRGRKYCWAASGDFGTKPVDELFDTREMAIDNAKKVLGDLGYKINVH